MKAIVLHEYGAPKKLKFDDNVLESHSDLSRQKKTEGWRAANRGMIGHGKNH
jgi:hypothetical protein